MKMPNQITLQLFVPFVKPTASETTADCEPVCSTLRPDSADSGHG